MSAILGVKWTLVKQPEIGLMDQRCALQSVPPTLPLEMVPRDVSQLPIYQGNQGFQRLLVARFPAHE